MLFWPKAVGGLSYVYLRRNTLFGESQDFPPSADVTGEAVFDLEARRPYPLTLTIYTSVNLTQDGRITPIPYTLHTLDQMDSTCQFTRSPFFDL